jgi:mono/diheme cytochrome c family protein
MIAPGNGPDDPGVAPTILFLKRRFLMIRLRPWLALALIAALPLPALAAGDAQEGKAIAERWCASCHLVSPDQTKALSDVPSFMSIAERSQGELGWLEAFLADPHPPMPNFSLTRQEIQDLVAYFASLSK